MKTKKQLIKELNRYKRLSLRDTLTGLYNRRKLDEDIIKYMARQKRYNDNYCIIMIDVDNFKQINDTKGHEEGDRVLKKIAKVLKETVRNYENCYRLSGDEFVLLVRVNWPSILKDRLKFRLERERIEVSIGISALQREGLKYADEAMYENKRSKKNVR